MKTFSFIIYSWIELKIRNDHCSCFKGERFREFLHRGIESNSTQFVPSSVDSSQASKSRLLRQALAIASWAGEERALEQPRTARQPSYSFCLPQPLRTSLRSVEFKTVPVSINETRTQLPEIRLHSQKARRIKRNHV